MNDEAMIKQALNGDREAFALLTEAYWPVVERVARGILRDAQLAQDVAQDVFADIYMHRARYEPRFSFHAFAGAVARYKSIDLLRKRGEPAAALDPEMRDAAAPTPESAFAVRMFKTALYSAVEQLPEAHRQMLKAYALNSRSYEEIATEMGLSVAQVKVTLHRIRKKLRRLRDEWDN